MEIGQQGRSQTFDRGGQRGAIENYFNFKTICKKYYKMFNKIVLIILNKFLEHLRKYKKI